MADTPKDGKGGKDGQDKRKRYFPPKMVRHGNLETVAERITGLVAPGCCVTERIRASRKSATARESLMSEVSRMVASSR